MTQAEESKLEAAPRSGSPGLCASLRDVLDPTVCCIAAICVGGTLSIQLRVFSQPHRAHATFAQLVAYGAVAPREHKPVGRPSRQHGADGVAGDLPACRFGVVEWFTHVFLDYLPARHVRLPVTLR